MNAHIGTASARLGAVVLTAAFVLLGTGAVVSAQSSFPDVRMIVGASSNGEPHLLDVKGALVLEPATGRIRFEEKGIVLFEASYDRLTGLQFEKSTYSPRAWTRSSLFLAISLTNAGGEPIIESFRLPKASAEAILAAVERDTGLTVDRTSEQRRFLGVPLATGRGQSVFVTNDAGVRTQATVLRVSPSAIELSPGGRLDVASVRKIELADSVSNGVETGILIGFLGGVLLAASSVDEAGSTCLVIGGSIALGGVIGGHIDKSITRTLYAAPGGTRTVHVGAVVTRAEKSVRVGIRF